MQLHPHQNVLWKQASVINMMSSVLTICCCHNNVPKTSQVIKSRSLFRPVIIWLSGTRAGDHTWNSSQSSVLLQLMVESRSPKHMCAGDPLLRAWMFYIQRLTWYLTQYESLLLPSINPLNGLNLQNPNNSSKGPTTSQQCHTIASHSNIKL